MYLSLLLTVALSANAKSLEPGVQTRNLKVDGIERSYLVYMPAKKPAGKSWPVVLAFHGGATNADVMMRSTGLNDKADKEGFLVVYPNGTGRVGRILTFNGGNCCGYAQRNNIDDVKFVDKILDDLAASTDMDEKRVFATGISNGAIISYRLASELSHRIAAIAPVAGPMGSKQCSPKHSVSVCHFHGTDDQFAPLKGGRGSKSLSQTDFYSVQHSIDAWVKANHCEEKPTVTKLPVKVKDGTSIERRVHAGGRDGAEVVLYMIHGGGHTWPGREFRLRRLGTSTKNLSANDVMWEFFKRHGRQ